MRRGNAAVRCVQHISLRREKAFWGPGVAQLLHYIVQHKSLRAAAQQMNMSYSKAWKIIHEAEDALGFPLIATISGGAKGGGSYLTAQGENLLRAYDTMVAELENAVQESYAVHIQPLLEQNYHPDKGEI